MTRKRSWLSIVDNQQVESDITSDKWVIIRIYHIWRTNDKAGGANEPKYKVVPASYSHRSKVKHKKAQLELLIKIVDHMIHEFDLEKELSDMFD